MTTRTNLLCLGHRKWGLLLTWTATRLYTCHHSQANPKCQFPSRCPILWWTRCSRWWLTSDNSIWTWTKSVAVQPFPVKFSVSSTLMRTCPKILLSLWTQPHWSSYPAVSSTHKVLHSPVHRSSRTRLVVFAWRTIRRKTSCSRWHVFTSSTLHASRAGSSPKTTVLCAGSKLMLDLRINFKNQSDWCLD